MKFRSYLRDSFAKICMYFVMMVLVLAVLTVFKVNVAAVGCVGGVLAVFGLTLLIYEYVRKRKFYADMGDIMQKLDKKYLLAEMLEAPDFLEGQMVMEVLRETDKATAEEVGGYRRQVKDFREYVELWVHEIKTPLTGLSLKLRGEDRAIKVYLNEIENYIEQALYYSKIDMVEKDYVIKNVSLAEVVKNVIRRNKDSLIMGKVKVKLDEVCGTVRSDAKWLEFVISQVVSNAIKYRGENPELLVWTEKAGSSVALCVRDNGIGIRKPELRRVFEKGFTGSNDRRTRASTGMGLYIARELCRGLGHEIAISSELGEFTEVRILFGENDFYLTQA